MRRPIALLAALLAGCATAPTPAPTGAEGDPGAPRYRVLREAELARVRCLVVAPLVSASDIPGAATGATGALAAAVDPTRARVLPVPTLRAIFADTPLELPDGVPGGDALELAELLGADAALYGTVEGRGRGAAPELLVGIRLALAGERRLLLAATAEVVPAPGEPLEAAVERTALALARPALDRLGSPGPFACFPPARREALRAAAVALGASPAPEGSFPSHPPVSSRPSAVARGGGRPPALAGAPPLRTDRQRDWARRLSAGSHLALDDVAFAGRSAALVRDGGLADLAAVLAASPGLRIRLEGFVDATADAAEDERLSAAMARTAARRLGELGVPPDQVATAGLGGADPILPNFTTRGRAANRRVEVVVAP